MHVRHRPIHPIPPHPSRSLPSQHRNPATHVVHLISSNLISLSSNATPIPPPVLHHNATSPHLFSSSESHPSPRAYHSRNVTSTPPLHRHHPHISHRLQLSNLPRDGTARHSAPGPAQDLLGQVSKTKLSKCQTSPPTAADRHLTPLRLTHHRQSFTSFSPLTAPLPLQPL